MINTMEASLVGRRLVWVATLLGWFSLTTTNHSVVAAAKKETSLLMIGNSFTDANDLEEMVGAMLQEDLNTSPGGVYTMRFRRPGAKLYQYASDSQVKSTIAERTWTWVVLQEQSEIPGFYDLQNEAYEKSLNAVDTLNGWIEKAQAETILLMTWGQQRGDPLNPSIYQDFETMQSRLAHGYAKMQKKISTLERPVRIAPVGLAFQAVHDAVVVADDDPTADGTDFSNLYAVDGKHPSVEGSYLVACVLYATLSGKDPRHVKYKPNGVTAKRQEALQEIAQATVERFNRDNEINHQFFLHQGMKPYHPPVDKNPVYRTTQGENDNDDASAHNLWFLFPLVAAVLIVMAVQQQRRQQQQQQQQHQSTRSRHLVGDTLAYNPILPHAHEDEDSDDIDVELVDMPSLPQSLSRQSSV